MCKTIDLVGRRFGFLTVIEKSQRKAKSGSMWVCQCACGNRKDIAASNLLSGNTRSCGCSRGYLKMKTRDERGLVRDLRGQRFGHLTVVSKSDRRSGSNPVWKCICDCGNTSEVIQENLLSNHTTSCGCKSSRNSIGTRSRTHGMSNTRLYFVWGAMKNRCLNPKVDMYPNYGGRGITICTEWLESFQVFHDWTVGSGYDADADFGDCTIDRIDNDDNYYPKNCRWVDMKTQANNKKRKYPKVVNYGE